MRGKCPSCGTGWKVDDSKVPKKGVYGRCKGCGHRFFVSTTKANPTCWKTMLCMFIAFLLLLGFCSRSCYRSCMAPSKPGATKVASSSWDGGVYQVKNYLKRNLKDPRSLDVIAWSPVVKRSDGGYQVRCKYRAKNSLGGYVINNQVFVMNSKGNVIDVYNF